jgi:hypothetical protein
MFFASTGTSQARVNLDEMDKAINRISFEVSSSLRTSASRFVQTLLKKHGFERMAIVSTEDVSQ